MTFNSKKSYFLCCWLGNEYYQRIIQPNNSAPSSPSSFGNPTHSSPAMIANNINNNSSMNPMIDHRKKKSNIFLD